MRLLLIHSDYIEYEAQKQTPMAEQNPILRDSLEDGLVAFCAVEEADIEDLEGVIRQAVEEIAETARKVHADRVMIYPYAHLSSELAPPDVAVAALKAIEEGLSGRDGLMVKRAPFGWYKAFKLACKGHPLSELSRTILPSEEAKKEAYLYLPQLQDDAASLTSKVQQLQRRLIATVEQAEKGRVSTKAAPAGGGDVPAGIDPETWKHMPEDKKKLFR